jgi:DUF1680 family protein
MKTLRPAALKDVTFHDGFWKDRIDTNRADTIPHEYELCKSTLRLDGIRAVKDRMLEVTPHHFWDSDVAKWIEAAAYSLATQRDRALEERIDEVVALIERAQDESGYYNQYFCTVHPEQKWSNLRDMHELYSAGHLMEAATAYYEATGKKALLDVMCRFADHIDVEFGPQQGKRRGYPGHEEVELALVKLYRATGEKRYLDLAAFFVNERGKQPHYFKEEAKARGEALAAGGDGGGRDPVAPFAYAQAHVPVREQATAEGHSVRALYLYSGMADVAAETSDRELLAACKRLWKNITQKRMYVTGGVGSTQIGERFTYDYDLPNGTAYAETCANIALVFFAHRLLQIEPKAAYADVMELALYNGVASGVSADGTKFFYDNLLTVQPRKHAFSNQKSPFRQEWFGCACCPTNIARLYASLGPYAYSTDETTAYVHLYAAGEARLDLGGDAMTLTQTTRYPWDGRVDIRVEAPSALKTGIALRIPGWSRGAALAVNGKTLNVKRLLKDGYAVIRRAWKTGDRIRLDLPMPVERIEADPRVAADCGCVALKRGPVVYCLEEADNGAVLAGISLPRASKLRVTQNARVLDGAVLITGKALRRSVEGWKDQLYRPAASKQKTVSITAVPYCLWNNRAEGEMLVWIREA